MVSGTVMSLGTLNIFGCMVIRVLNNVIGGFDLLDQRLVLSMAAVASLVFAIVCRMIYRRNSSLALYDVSHIDAGVVYRSTVRNAWLAMRFIIGFWLSDVVLLAMYLYFKDFAFLFCLILMTMICMVTMMVGRPVAWFRLIAQTKANIVDDETRP